MLWTTLPHTVATQLPVPTIARHKYIRRRIGLNSNEIWNLLGRAPSLEYCRPQKIHWRTGKEKYYLWMLLSIATIFSIVSSILCLGQSQQGPINVVWLTDPSCPDVVESSNFWLIDPHRSSAASVAPTDPPHILEQKKNPRRVRFKQKKICEGKRNQVLSLTRNGTQSLSTDRLLTLLPQKDHSSFHSLVASNWTDAFAWCYLLGRTAYDGKQEVLQSLIEVHPTSWSRCRYHMIYSASSLRRSSFTLLSMTVLGQKMGNKNDAESAHLSIFESLLGLENSAVQTESMDFSKQSVTLHQDTNGVNILHWITALKPHSPSETTITRVLTLRLFHHWCVHAPANWNIWDAFPPSTAHYNQMDNILHFALFLGNAEMASILIQKAPYLLIDRNGVQVAPINIILGHYPKLYSMRSQSIAASDAGPLALIFHDEYLPLSQFNYFIRNHKERFFRQAIESVLSAQPLSPQSHENLFPCSEESRLSLKNLISFKLTEDTIVHDIVKRGGVNARQFAWYQKQLKEEAARGGGKGMMSRFLEYFWPSFGKRQ